MIQGPPSIWGSGSTGNTLVKAQLLPLKAQEKMQFSFPALFNIVGDNHLWRFLTSNLLCETIKKSKVDCVCVGVCTCVHALVHVEIEYHNLHF